MRRPHDETPGRPVFASRPLDRESDVLQQRGGNFEVRERLAVAGGRVRGPVRRLRFGFVPEHSEKRAVAPEFQLAGGLSEKVEFYYDNAHRAWQ